MRFLPLLLANFRRKRVRTALTVGSFAVALFLFGLLAAVRGAFNQGVEIAGADRLVVVNRIAIIQPLPVAYRERLARIPGVADVTFAWWFGGVYRDERNFFPQFAVEHESYKRMFPEFVVPREQWAAFLADRQGCVAGEALARRFGWKLGDRIPLKGTIFPGLWELNLRAIYHGRRPQDDTGQFWLRYDYLYEKAPPWIRGLVGWYWVRVAHPEDAVKVAAAIDETFANSPWETRAQTEKAFAAGWVRQMGNVQLLILSIGGVVFFTLLLVTGNTMAMAVRERTGELAVLKAVGYSDVFVLGLVLAESVLVALAGGGLGLALAKLLVSGGDPTGGFLPVFYVPPSALAAGAGAAVLVGLAAGLLPALSAMRLSVVQALRRV